MSNFVSKQDTKAPNNSVHW